MIYLIKSNGFYKIGYTNGLESLKKRMGSYKTHNPSYKLIGLSNGDKKKEKELHKLHKDYRVNNHSEWFDFGDNVNELFDVFATTELEQTVFLQLGLVSKEITEYEIGEIYDSVTYYINNIKIDLIHTENKLYVTCLQHNRGFLGTHTVLEVQYEDLKHFYRDYDEYREKYWGFKIDDKLYYTFRGMYGESTGVCSIQTPLFNKVKSLLKDITY